MSFYDILEQKKPFQAIKKRSSKTRNIDIFPKGLTDGFGKKMVIFPNLFFQAKQPRKISFTIFYNKKTPFQAIKIKNSKSPKIDIFPKWLTHRFGPKMVIFRKPFFQAIQPRKMSFTIFQNEKTPFQAIKTKNLKSLKIFSFPIELTHGFGPKKSIFSIFFYPIYIGQENVFYDNLQRKNSFLGYKEKKFKKSNN